MMLSRLGFGVPGPAEPAAPRTATTPSPRLAEQLTTNAHDSRAALASSLAPT